MNNERFHMSLPCKDVPATRKFYENELGFQIGRKTYKWFDVNIFGNQITFTQDNRSNLETQNYLFEDIQLPSFHFGVLLDYESWIECFERYKDKDYFVIGATKFLTDRIGEHKSFYLKDVNGYFIEFKCFSDKSEIFESNGY